MSEDCQSKGSGESRSCQVLLEMDRVSMGFDGVHALSGLSFSIGEGEVVGMVGPNGSGKTTALNLISGIYTPNHGAIRYRGRNIIGVFGHENSALGISRTFQSPRLFESLSAFQHIVAGLPHLHKGTSIQSLLNQYKGTWRSRSSEASELLGLVGLGTEDIPDVASLPYGLQRTLELARALASKPDLLLLDEPTAGLNEEESQAICRVLKRVHASRGVSMIVIEHDFSFIESLCSRVLVLSEGTIVCDGSPEEIRDDLNAVMSYIGEGE